MRLDRRLVEAGLAVSRARAVDFVRRGCVTVAGETVLKPADMVAGDVALALSSDAGAYVSRAALKLEAALEKDRERSVTRVRDFLEDEGWQVLGVTQSPIEGGSGNIEFLIGARHGA